MELKELLTADYLDIVFDKRNKQYGSYELRRNYNKRIIKGSIAIVLLAGLFAASAFMHVTASNSTTVYTNPTIISAVKLNEPPVLPPKKIVTPPPQPAAGKKVKMFRSTEPVVTADDWVLNLPAKPTTTGVPGPITTDGDSTGLASTTTTTTGGGVAGTGGNEEPAKNTPFVYVQQMPAFAGDMQQYLAAHLHYPDAAVSSGIEGQVVIKFIVNEDGHVSDAQVMRGIGGGCDEEALRIVRNMPAWKPGKQNGAAVKVFFMIPIRFELK